MPVRNLFIDVSDYQNSSYAYFKRMKDLGAKSVIIKLTEGSSYGSNWKSQTAAAKIRNASDAGLVLGFYHFARYTSLVDAENEAKFFIDFAKALGVQTNSMMVDDAEVHTMGDYTGGANAFLNQLRSSGFSKVGLYSMKSFYTSGILNSHAVGDAKNWVAGYGITSLGIDNAAAWQADDGQGYEGMPFGCDASFDFDGAFTTTMQGGSVPTAPVKPQQQVEQKWRPATGTYTVKWGDTLSSLVKY